MTAADFSSQTYTSAGIDLCLCRGSDSDLLYYNFFIDFFFLPCLPLRASIFRAVSLHINQYPNKVHSYALPIFARLLVMLVISFSLHSIFEKHVFEGMNSIIIWLC